MRWRRSEAPGLAAERACVEVALSYNCFHVELDAQRERKAPRLRERERRTGGYLCLSDA